MYFCVILQLQFYMEWGYAENDCRLSEAVFILLWQYDHVTFPPLRDILNNLPFRSCKMDAEMVSQHVHHMFEKKKDFVTIKTQKLVLNQDVLGV